LQYEKEDRQEKRYTDNEILTAELLLLDRNTQALIAAYPAEVKILYNRMGTEGMVDESSAQVAAEISDFVYTRPILVHNGIRRLLYSVFGEWMLSPVFRDRPLSSEWFERGLQFLAMLFGLSMVLWPTGFMYLMELSKSASYGLVGGFIAFFSAIFAVSNVTFEYFFLGTLAYAALLISILVQTQACGGCLCA
jgi:hypothetical protein